MKEYEKDEKEREMEKKESEAIERIAERNIEKELTFVVRKSRHNRREKLDSWMKRHAGETKNKVARMWSSETEKWLIFQEKEGRESLLAKRSKVNGDDIYSTEEVLEGRERWCRNFISQEDGLVKPRAG